MTVPGFVESVRVYGDGCSNWIMLAYAWGVPFYACAWGRGEMRASEALHHACPIPVDKARMAVEGRSVAAEWSRELGFCHTVDSDDIREGDISWEG